MLGARTVASARAWPEADAAFRSDLRWIGSDDASSIELSPGRILWLFGDTFICAEPGGARDGAAFPRNTIAIQHGSDPAAASVTMHWATDEHGEPVSFFPAPPGAWHWPLHGARIGEGLIVFAMLVRSPRPGGDPIQDWRELGSLGFFRVDGWAVFRIDEPDADPRDWRAQPLAVRDEPIVLGASVLVDGDHVLAYGWDADKRVFLARWPLDVFAGGDLPPPQWWSARGWDAGPGDVVIEDGATEFSVHRDAESGCYIQTQTAFRERGIGLRFAPTPAGPWSELSTVYVTEEAPREDVFVYAAKAHPELSGSELSGAELVVTYASNSDADTCIADQSIYYPRFVRIALERP